MDTINRLTDIFVTMNNPADRDRLFQIIQMLYELMGLRFSEEAAPMGARPEAFDYFLFSFTVDFGEIIKTISRTAYKPPGQASGVLKKNAAFLRPLWEKEGAHVFYFRQQSRL